MSPRRGSRIKERVSQAWGTAEMKAWRWGPGRGDGGRRQLPKVRCKVRVGVGSNPPNTSSGRTGGSQQGGGQVNCDQMSSWGSVWGQKGWGQLNERLSTPHLRPPENSKGNQRELQHPLCAMHGSPGLNPNSSLLNCDLGQKAVPLCACFLGDGDSGKGAGTALGPRSHSCPFSKPPKNLLCTSASP